MFNDDTSNDYYRADNGWCRDDNDVKDNYDSGCIHCGSNSKDDEAKMMIYAKFHI